MTETTAPRVEDVSAPGGAVRVLTLQDHARHNALTPGAVARLAEEIALADQDDQVGALILTHSGRTFCAGSDLDHLTLIADDPTRTRAFLAELVGLIRRLEQLSKFTVAAIEGPAVGGGFELALACDARVLGADAWVRLPEVSFGALPGGGGLQRLTRFIGRGRTLQMVLLAERVGAQSCADLGLGAVVPAGTALQKALDIARTVTGYARIAVSGAKRLIQLAEDLPLADLDPMAVEAMVQALASSEGREGLAALHERRQPNFEDARVRSRGA